VPAPCSSALRLRVGVTRVTLGIAVSWTLLVMVAVTRSNQPVTTRWLVMLPPYWNSLGDCLPSCLGTGSVSGYTLVGFPWQKGSWGRL